MPGRPKTDVLDAVWLCEIAERQMIRPSFVPPPQIRRLRDLTRYRYDLVNTATAEKNGRRNYWRTPRSKSASWPVTSSARPAGT
ncbi:transposase [Planotetraspora sp. GP83]|uniref:IS110 family transposase n=1 Tax=Planotetraspora sp. GP83 TaxID=3156264 RepID=UPI003519757F